MKGILVFFAVDSDGHEHCFGGEPTLVQGEDGGYFWILSHSLRGVGSDRLKKGAIERITGKRVDETNMPLCCNYEEPDVWYKALKEERYRND